MHCGGLPALAVYHMCSILISCYHITASTGTWFVHNSLGTYILCPTWLHPPDEIHARAFLGLNWVYAQNKLQLSCLLPSWHVAAILDSYVWSFGTEFKITRCPLRQWSPCPYCGHTKQAGLAFYFRPFSTQIRLYHSGHLTYSDLSWNA